MSYYSLKKIEAVKGKQNFFKLEKDGKCEFDEFETKVRIFFNSEMDRIYALMNRAANLESLTSEQFKDITPHKELVKEYEFKTRHLRVYAFKEEKTGKVVINGGLKTTQKQDINHFREIKKIFLLNRDKL